MRDVFGCYFELCHIDSDYFVHCYLTMIELRISNNSRFSVSETLQVFIPLDRQKILFFIVARLTGRYKITPGAFSSSSKGNNMIHG